MLGAWGLNLLPVLPLTTTEAAAATLVTAKRVAAACSGQQGQQNVDNGSECW
jgi:hypothetical protein